MGNGWLNSVPLLRLGVETKSQSVGEGRREVRRSVPDRSRRCTLLLAASLLGMTASWPFASYVASPSTMEGRQHQLTLAQIITPEDVIVGRTIDRAAVVLLTENRRLIRIDLAQSRVTSSRVQAADQDSLWGLGHAGHGELWTLLNRLTLAQISLDGRIVRRLTLGRPHVGLFSIGGLLVYQSLPRPDQPLLRLGVPGEEPRAAISSLKPRQQDAGLADMLAASLVMCGGTHGVELPCWLPDEVVLHLIGRDGSSRALRLSALAVPDGSESEMATHGTEAQPQPIWDAFVDGSSTWVLADARETAHSSFKSGRELLRFGPLGNPIGARPLSTPARLILDVQNGHVWLLLTSGVIERITMP